MSGVETFTSQTISSTHAQVIAVVIGSTRVTDMTSSQLTPQMISRTLLGTPVVVNVITHTRISRCGAVSAIVAIGAISGLAPSWHSRGGHLGGGTGRVSDGRGEHGRSGGNCQVPHNAFLLGKTVLGLITHTR